jgi:hypothetical protein
MSSASRSERAQNDPSPEQLAAIIAAVEVAWPRPVVVVDDAPEQVTPWRFSNRWWTPRRAPASARIRP